MDQFIENLIGELEESPTELSDKNKKKIYEYIPIPNDFDILWADINSFGGYPSGIILTNKGIVCKAPRPSIREKKPLKNNEKVYQIPYQILLWEYFDPDDFVYEKDENGSCYVVKRDGRVVTVFQDKSLICFFEKYASKLRMEEDLANSLIDGAVISELETFNMENAAFNAAYGEDQSATGHGIYAEEAGAVLDKLNGEKVTVVGRDNAKNGPDKLVNGNPVQCKFCKNAGSSIGACFKKNPNTGQMEYRYFDIKSGKPMMVEVPADQYEKAVEAMRRRISKGQVPGVTDPNMATELVRKSKITYAQAKNLAQAGTFESLTFDTATGAINCSFAAGISSLASFGITFWRTNDPKKARDAAIDTAINVFGPALAVNILTNQIARTGLSKALIPISNKIVEQLGTRTVQRLINARRVLLGQKKIYGNAANKSLAKALRGNAVVEGITFIVFSTPDTYRVSMGKISGAQYTKNMISSVASFIGSIAGTYGAGMAAGAVGEKIGKKVGKRAGAVIGFVAGAGGGMLAGVTVNKIFSLFKEDDCIITARLFNAVVANMSIDYFMSEEEIDELVDALDKDSKKIGKFQMKVRVSEHQYYDTQKFLEPYFEKVIGGRKYISERSTEEIYGNSMNVEV
ncbi:hypothetical protein HDR58_00145 [bacterium]|nr:hypothetical protein [bacterium]